MRIGPFIAVVILGATYILSGRLHYERIRRQSEFLSAAAGVTLAYVFVDLLPVLAKRQVVFAATKHHDVLFPEKRVYIAALLGFLTFYSLEHMAVRSRGGTHHEGSETCGLTCYLDTLGFAIYSGLVAYSINRWVQHELLELLFFTIAMALHFLVIGHSLREEQGDVYSLRTRYVLAGAVLVGYALGEIRGLPEAVLDTLVGFIAGGVVINSITKEMPKEGEERFRAFVIGALLYAALLLVAG